MQNPVVILKKTWLTKAMTKKYRLIEMTCCKVKKIEPCRRCWEDEKNGFFSLRQSSLEDFKNYKLHQGLMMLDLRLSNNCNLACSMCGSHASSLWAKLQGKHDLRTLSSALKQSLLGDCKDLIRLSVQGGEPFYGDDFIDFIDSIPNKSSIQLEIFTNTVTANIDMIERWSREFNHVMIISSVDGIGDTFEFIRWPAQWHKFEKKIVALSKISKLGLSFAFTVQNINILNIADFISWRDATVPACPITFNVLELPAHFHFTVLDAHKKQQALDMLGKIDSIYDEEVQALMSIKAYLESHDVDEKMLQHSAKKIAGIQALREQHMDKS